MITDALQGMEGSEISVPSGPASIPRNDAMISVRTIPSGADISVDFQPVGKTPLIDRTIGLGSHVITVRMDGFATFDTLITVGSGEEHEFSLTLRESRRLHELALEPEEPVTAEPAAVAAAPPQAAAEPQDPTPNADEADEAEEARLVILSEPSGASVTADGRHLGTTPLQNVSLEPGDYTLRFTLPDHHSAEQSVHVAAGESASVTVTLLAEVGTLRILALPWASIYVDGELVAENSNLRHTIDLPAGNHLIRAEHPVLGEHERSIRVISGEVTDVVIDLNQ